MLFSGKENVFMCLVAFQKNFRKIFSDVWLYSWKYHRKHIFYLLLTFSQLPNKHIMSFIPKNSNKTQKRSYFLVDFDDRDRRRSVRSRSWSMSIGAVPVTGEIAIVVRWCGSFRLAWCVGRSSEALREAVRVWERSACEREEEKVWSENKDWKWFQSFLAEFSIKLKIFSVWPNLPCQPNALFSEKWFPNFIFSQNK